MPTIQIFVLLFLSASSWAQGRDGGFQCQGGTKDPYDIVEGGLRWTLNAEPRSEAEARERIRAACRASRGWSDPFGSTCKSEAATAVCGQVTLFHCSGRAAIRDRWGRREGSRVELLRLGVVYLPEGEETSKVAASYSEFCRFAMERNLFGVVPAGGAESFCEETASTLRCE